MFFEMSQFIKKYNYAQRHKSKSYQKVGNHINVKES